MAEPTRYSMSTGLPVEKEVKSYSLESQKSPEQSFWDFVAKHEQSRKDWIAESKRLNENYKEGDKT